MTELMLSRLSPGESSHSALRPADPPFASGNADNLFVTCSTNVSPARPVTAITCKTCTWCTLSWPAGKPSRGQTLYL